MKLPIGFLAGMVTAGIAITQASGQQQFPTTGSVIRLEPEIDQLITPGTLPEILAEGFNWSEGPLWLPAEEVLIFSDVPENTIFRWDEQNGLQPYLTPSGYTGSIPRGGETGSNGLLLDPQGRLVLCQHGDRRMARMNAPLERPEAAFTTLTGQWEGKRFNSPNDAVYGKDGTLYFTDPAYGLELGYKDPAREMDFTGIFSLSLGGVVTLLSDRLSAPNGIGLSPDQKRLYVANSGGPSGPIWMVYELGENGSLAGEGLFHDATTASDTLRGAPDGLVVGTNGTLFATGPGGVWIFNPDGKHLGIVRTGQATSNCTLDAREQYLYITADMYLMRIRLRD